jgi:putative spermidine/putrescine transport system ATP-binding protein
MSEMKTAIKFTNISKTFDGKSYAVRDLCLDVHEGEFLTLLGPSGSGKTTTLLMVAGFETPSQGDILMGGRSISRLPPYKRNIGVVFQNYALFPHMTVEENVAFPLVMRGLSKSDAMAKVKPALDMVQLLPHRSRQPSQLSGGQQQRAALARALVFDPLLVLMDEPLGALDKKLREQMQLEIRQIHRRLGNTFISVTHDQSEALTMSDRVAIFNDGKLQQVAIPADVYESPENLFVARFIGDTNSLKGSVAELSPGHCMVRLNNGQTILARLPHPLQVGQKAIISLRPERLVVIHRIQLDGLANRIKGRVRESIYLGDHFRHLVEVEGQGDWIVRTSGGEGDHPLAEGNWVELAWKADDCLALDPSP